MTIYDIQNAQKTPIWKQRIIECRSSGLSVKEWCKERGLDFTTYYRWERKILTSIIPAEDVPGLPGPNLPSVTPAQNTAVHMYFSVKPISVKASLSCQAFVGFGLIVSVYQRHDQSFRAVQQDTDSNDCRRRDEDRQRAHPQGKDAKRTGQAGWDREER